MKKPKVFLNGGDEIGWAIDEDLRLSRLAMENIVEFASLEDCEVVHSVWWEGLIRLDARQLKSRIVLCHVPGEPFRYFGVPGHRHAMSVVNLWVPRTSQAERQLRSLGINSLKIPYLIDADIFRPLGKNDPASSSARKRFNIPDDSYLIGNFSRDSEGSNLLTPKLVKGPDIFLQIVRQLKTRGAKIHVLLAGPRRHWLLAHLHKDCIPFSYIGTAASEDDLQTNLLSRDELNILYNLLDLYVVPSRSEGGPHAILEASAALCKIISTDVGLARDVLDEQCIYSSVPHAVAIIMRDIETGHLGSTVGLHRVRVLENHVPEKAKSLFQDLYKEVRRLQSSVVPQRHHAGDLHTVNESIPARALNPQKKEKKFTVGLWHKFFAPPYGGGNQFMMALRKALQKKGVEVRENELNPDIDAYILNSIHFDVEAFLEFSRTHRINVIHRIDGPIHLIRGFDREKDELCYELNARFASATVLQSAWTYQRIVGMGYSPVSPVIIHNAVDNEIFHPTGRIPFSRERRIRLISTSWSNNPRKGGAMYKWIEHNIDWNKYEFSFVGNVSESLERALHIPPVSSEELANILRENDIYVTASQNDPCSNALIEAMACGLPALYLDDGGHPELVKFGGLPFHSFNDFLPALGILTENYQAFQALITVSSLDEVAEKYLTLAREVAAS